MTRIAVLLVNWNALDVTLDCIDSLYRTGYPDIAIIVVDNGSRDRSAEVIKQTYGSVIVLENLENRGFSIANNQAIRYALRNGFEMILVLNNDTTVDRHLFQKLVKRMVTSFCDIVVPAIYFAERPTHYWFAVGKANLWTGIFSNPFNKKDDRGATTDACEMDFAVGCCFLARTDVFRKIGGFDERFFMYCEDIDWSFRARASGFKIALEPEAKVYHRVSFSGDKAPRERRFYMTRNHLWVLRRHSRWYHRLVWVPLVPIRALYRIGKVLLGRDLKCILSEARGVTHGLFDRLPPTPRTIT